MAKTNAVEQRVLNYLTSNADVPHAMTSIAESTGLTKVQVSGAVSALRRQFPNLEVIKRGIYRWNSTPTATHRKELSLKVMKTKDDGSMLCQDLESDALFVVTLMEW